MLPILVILNASLTSAALSNSRSRFLFLYRHAHNINNANNTNNAVPPVAAPIIPQILSSMYFLLCLCPRSVCSGGAGGTETGGTADSATMEKCPSVMDRDQEIWLAYRLCSLHNTQGKAKPYNSLQKNPVG
ncbi:hypothetical protein HanPSC8_Chr06g0240351 [Helianthus annuus]|nr:hypothetical protein HanPSC8_Chr06g0240351 [Helianthus annuus]